MFRAPEPANMDLNLAPMVDVMMCLIIFFLLASKIVDAEDVRALELPWAVAAAEVEKAELGNRVTINVLRPDPDPAAVAEYIVVEWNAAVQDIVQTPRSPEFIQQLLVARAQRAREEGRELRCVIRADEDAHYADVEVVLRAAGVAQIGKIVFATNRGAGPGDS